MWGRAGKPFLDLPLPNSGKDSPVQSHIGIGALVEGCLHLYQLLSLFCAQGGLRYPLRAARGEMGQSADLTGPQKGHTRRDVVSLLGPQDREGEKKEGFTLPSPEVLQRPRGIIMLLPLLSC